jgi:hypothetical protein
MELHLEDMWIRRAEKNQQQFTRQAWSLCPQHAVIEGTAKVVKQTF